MTANVDKSSKQNKQGKLTSDRRTLQLVEVAVRTDHSVRPPRLPFEQILVLADYIVQSSYILS